MKHLYTITFDSDSSSEEVVDKQDHTPIKPTNTSSRIRPIPKHSQIKITTIKLSEEYKNESYTSTEETNSEISHKKRKPIAKSSEKTEFQSDKSSNDYISLTNQNNIDNQKGLKNEDNKFIDENEEKGKQIKKHSQPNSPPKNNATPQPPNTKNDNHNKFFHRHLHQRNKITNDINGDFNNDNDGFNHDQNDINQLHVNNNDSQTNIISKADKNIGDNNNHNNQDHNDTINKNVKMNNQSQLNLAASNSFINNIFPQKLGDPLHFTIIRQMKTKSIFNKRSSFLFTDTENNCLFEAKPEKGSHSIMNITYGAQYDQVCSQIPPFFNDSKSTVGQLGVIICSPDFDSFSLRLNNQYGCELMAVLINSKKCKNSSSSSFVDHEQHHQTNDLNPNFDLNGILRLAKVNFFIDKSDKKEKRLQNAESFGIVLDFGNRSVVQSTKNFIFLDCQRREFVAIRKVEKNKLCVDFQPSIPALCAFALGLIAFLYKV